MQEEFQTPFFLNQPFFFESARFSCEIPIVIQSPCVVITDLIARVPYISGHCMAHVTTAMLL